MGGGEKGGKQRQPRGKKKAGSSSNMSGESPRGEKRMGSSSCVRGENGGKQQQPEV